MICNAVAVVVVKVSNGALDMAKANMELLLCHCAKLLSFADSELTTAQSKSMFDTVHELVRHVTSPNTVVRDQVFLFLILFLAGSAFLTTNCRIIAMMFVCLSVWNRCAL